MSGSPTEVATRWRFCFGPAIGLLVEPDRLLGRPERVVGARGAADDANLLDPSAGKSIRWVEGRGWADRKK